MNRQNLLIILIIASGSTLGGLAYGVSNGSIIVGDLTITGTCTGCGTESSFTNYNIIALNTTMPGSDTFGLCAILVGNDGSTLSGGSVKTQLVYLNGTTVYDQNTIGCNEYPPIAQSVTGEYKVVMNATSFIGTVFKNGNLIKNLGLNIAQYHTANGLQIGISPNGKYISVVGRDSGAASDRIVVFQGS